MIEYKPIYQLFARVKVVELDATGYVYESATAIDSAHRVYGIRLDKIAFPKNFVATEVWHCQSEGLEPSSPLHRGEEK